MTDAKLGVQKAWATVGVSKCISSRDRCRSDLEPVTNDRMVRTACAMASIVVMVRSEPCVGRARGAKCALLNKSCSCRISMRMRCVGDGRDNW